MGDQVHTCQADISQTAASSPSRRAERRRLTLSGRLTWRDARGIPRFASVLTRDVSEAGVYLECRGGEPIPLYRLVYLQLEREGRDAVELPATLKDGRVLSAVTRIGPCEPSTGTPSGYALRLLVEPPVSARRPVAEAERSIA